MVFALRKTAFENGQILEIGGAAVRLKVNARARRVSLRLDPIKREVVATAPSARRLKDAVDFAVERSSWIAETVAGLPKRDRLEAGAVIEVLGRPCQLETAGTRAAVGLTQTEEGFSLRALGEGDIFATRAIRLLKRHALDVLAERTAHHAQGLGRPVPPVAIMDAKSRWGSCTPPRGGKAGSIRYSWRLVLAPDWVLDYVAAHECAHLVEANHGPRFWALVRERVGSERPARAWLRANGNRIQAV
jgi:predicted metal-dependent hydrolase